MIPVLYALVVLVFSINVLLGLPRAVELVQIKTSSANIPDNRVINVSEAQKQAVDIKKTIQPPKSLNTPAPHISATSALVLDTKTNFQFFAKEVDKRVPIASTTKIMTAVLGSKNYKANEILTVPDLLGVDGSTMGLKSGEKITLRSLLYGLLLNSGNDAAYTIAANFPGGVTGFVTAMNQKALELNLVNTHFDNPAGYDSVNHYSSAADLSKIAMFAMEDSQLVRVVATKEASVASADRTMIHSLKNLNKLLEMPGVLGIKTGTTPQAKENFVGLIERDNRKVLIVVLGSDDRFGETKALIDWTFNNYIWE